MFTPQLWGEAGKSCVPSSSLGQCLLTEEARKLHRCCWCHVNTEITCWKSICFQTFQWENISFRERI